MKQLKIVLVVLLIVSPAIARCQNTEIVIKTSAVCLTCKKAIEQALMDEKGVKFASLDTSTKAVKVIYNASKTTPERLRTAISLAGYDADDVPADSAAVKKLDPCCTKDKICNEPRK
ncbi:MAG TPA: cation transporter [Bacteroidia bacterium]|nr:cation transporter [Bacteroidia bacterium]